MRFRLISATPSDVCIRPENITWISLISDSTPQVRKNSRHWASMSSGFGNNSPKVRVLQDKFNVSQKIQLRALTYPAIDITLTTRKRLISLIRFQIDKARIAGIASEIMNFCDLSCYYS